MNVNVDIDGRSPLHYAADYGQIEVLQYLISKGANPNTQDKHGISVLLAAIWEGHTNCVKFLIQKVNLFFITFKNCEEFSILLKPFIQILTLNLQLLSSQGGATKDGQTPDGTKYIDAAEKAEIKALLRS